MLLLQIMNKLIKNQIYKSQVKSPILTDININNK